MRRLILMFGLSALLIGCSVLIWLLLDGRLGTVRDRVVLPTRTLNLAETADRLVEVLASQDMAALEGLVTGYGPLAARLRQSALQAEGFLADPTLTARHKLAILALRDRYDGAEIRRLSDWDVVQVHPIRGQSNLALPPNTPILIHKVQALGESRGLISAYMGATFRRLPLIRYEGRWQWNLAPILEPTLLTQADLEILDRIAALGAGPDAWLQIYAELSNTSRNRALLRLP